MPLKISKFEQERMVYVNNVMGEIHDSANEIYEALCDQEFKEVKETTSQLIIKLQRLIFTIEEEG